jgi:hypothetical protein
MYQKPTAPRSIGGVLDDTFQLYKASFSRCFVPALLAGIVVGVLAVYQVSRQLGGLPTTGNPADMQAYLVRNASNGVSSGLFSLLSILIDLVFYSIMVYIIAAVARGEPRSLGESLSPSLRRVPANLGATIVLAIIAFVCIVLVLVPMFIAMAGSVAHATLPQILARTGPAVLLCLVLSLPVIYILLRMALYMVPLVADSQGPLRSLAMSWRVVGSNWWRTFTLICVMAIIVYVLTILVLGIAGTVGVMIAGVPKGVRVISAAAEVGAVVGGVLRIFTGPLFAALLVSIYRDLQLRKGGGDLEARLGALPRS